MKLTIAIIALNEADRILSAIQSAQFADEVLVIDGGSSDDTVNLAVAAGARVVTNPWPGFVTQRNHALDLAVGSAVFFLDSDEVITSELQASILKVVETGEQGGRVRRRHIYLGRRMRYGFGAGWQTRLVKKGAGRWAGGSVHETLHVHGDVVDLDGPLMHEPYRDLDDHLARVDTYAALFAKDAHFGGRRARWFDLLVRPPLFFLKTYILRLGLLEGLAGLSLGAVGARYTWLKWHKLHRLSVQPTGRL